MSGDTCLSELIKNWECDLRTVSDSPRLDVEILIRHVSGFSDTQLITNADQALEPDVLRQLQALLDERRSGVPVAYLTGSREFYSLPLKITSQVLIPRPDTECLVELAIEHIRVQSAHSVLDLGTGSGAIALALAHQLPGVAVTATDRDEDALGLARQNATQLKLNEVCFIHSDWFHNIGTERFDVIVSNPPYVDPEDQHLQQGDVRFEPRTALVAQDHGLADLRKIICGASAHLNPGGRLLLEHGYDQAHAVTSMLLENSFESVETHKDFGQNDRISSGLRPG